MNSSVAPSSAASFVARLLGQKSVRMQVALIIEAEAPNLRALQTPEPGCKGKGVDQSPASTSSTSGQEQHRQARVDQTLGLDQL